MLECLSVDLIFCLGSYLTRDWWLSGACFSEVPRTFSGLKSQVWNANPLVLKSRFFIVFLTDGKPRGLLRYIKGIVAAKYRSFKFWDLLETCTRSTNFCHTQLVYVKNIKINNIVVSLTDTILEMHLRNWRLKSFVCSCAVAKFNYPTFCCAIRRTGVQHLVNDLVS